MPKRPALQHPAQSVESRIERGGLPGADVWRVVSAYPWQSCRMAAMIRAQVNSAGTGRVAHAFGNSHAGCGRRCHIDMAADLAGLRNQFQLRQPGQQGPRDGGAFA